VKLVIRYSYSKFSNTILSYGYSVVNPSFTYLVSSPFIITISPYKNSYYLYSYISKSVKLVLINIDKILFSYDGELRDSSFIKQHLIDIS
jgi:hypothetical protein